MEYACLNIETGGSGGARFALSEPCFFMFLRRFLSMCLHKNLNLYQISQQLSAFPLISASDEKLFNPTKFKYLQSTLTLIRLLTLGGTEFCAMHKYAPMSKRDILVISNISASHSKTAKEIEIQLMCTGN